MHCVNFPNRSQSASPTPLPWCVRLHNSLHWAWLVLWEIIVKNIHRLIIAVGLLSRMKSDLFNTFHPCLNGTLIRKYIYDK